MISGQFDRFIYRDNSGPLVAWQNNATNSSSWGCGKLTVDVFIALHKRHLSKPWVGDASLHPYLNHSTVVDIERYYRKERGANDVFIKIVDDSHMTEVETKLTRQLADRRLPNQYKQTIEEHREKKFGRYSQMLYMRHLAYAMTVQQHRTYSAYVSQREDTFFLEPLDFKQMGLKSRGSKKNVSSR